MESVIYLRNQLLRDSDWASMYHGIELRTPFVDVTLLNNLKNIFCYFPFFNIKAPLINCLTKKDLPKSITIKKKIGFETPIKQWIRELNKKRFNSLGWNDWMKTVSRIY